ncbi:hypothetical protein E2C01_039779 [Portunus trituberculatus]|uniref:Uncharacterized protein n=1 Tax=Portunus trituberculatus TaxID=210409 RepID=A0A5B7FEN8_PORTR|nr:hypothetical protein [Portunus trituberculatus]
MENRCSPLKTATGWRQVCPAADKVHHSHVFAVSKAGREFLGGSVGGCLAFTLFRYTAAPQGRSTASALR